MNNEQQKYYLNELSAQCQFALDAYADIQRLSSIIKSESKKHTAKDSRDLFRHLHSLFTHAGNISKLLFNRGKGKLRSEFLRKTLNIPDTGHLLESRTFRNHLEHYDERLDEWINDWVKHNYPEYFNTLSLLGNEQTHNISTLGSEEMRVFNYSTMRFIFQNDSFDIIQLIDVIREIHNNLTKLGADYQPKRYLISRLAPVENGDRL
ncbi:MAG: hypothetical protein HRF40_04980 [Nitrososphaera sp.]|jgi:hypothetical protein